MRRSLQASAAAGLVLAAAGSAGCVRTGPEAAPTLPASDTVTGEVQVVGSDPGAEVVIRTEIGQTPLAGPWMEALENAAGVVVEAVGSTEGARFHVQHFRVLRVGEHPAADGVLEIDGDAGILITRSGERMTYSPISDALRRRAGQWVWIAAEEGTEPRLWGVLSETPPER